jgi:hypothetical protein
MFAVVGLLVLVIISVGTQPALAQQEAAKAQVITLNYATFFPGSHPEWTSFNKGFISKAGELSKGRLAFQVRGGRRLSRSSSAQGNTKRDC